MVHYWESGAGPVAGTRAESPISWKPRPGPGILTVNAGSSSIKAALFTVGDGRPVLVARAEVTGIRKQALFVTEDADGRADTAPLPGVRVHADALGAMLEWVSHSLGGTALLAVGHRIVHGGEDHSGPVVATPALLDRLERLVPLAPMHQRTGLDAVHAVGALVPEIAQVLAFDTAFHATMPPPARTFALPRELVAQGIRRFGFHGLSYESVAGQLPAHLGAAADGRVVVAHLGSGASLCALLGRRSMATTMGMTPLDGLPMGTRCGALDPGVVLHLMREGGMTADQVEDLLYHRSGLFGLSGMSGRMEFLLRARTAAADEAVELFVYRTATEVATMASALGGLEALVFTAGIGERSAPIRARISARCRWMGLELDAAANDAGGPRISTDGSPVTAWVIPTDEERVLAGQALGLVTRARDSTGPPTRSPTWPT